MKSVPKNRKNKPFALDAICDAFSFKLDAYYIYRKRFMIKKQVENSSLNAFEKGEEPYLGKVRENST
jgi:hypothetical protein